MKDTKWCSTSGSDTGIVVRSGENKGRLLMAARASLDQRLATLQASVQHAEVPSQFDSGSRQT